MHRPQLIEARYQQGLNAYRAGQTIREMILLGDEISAMHQQPDLTDEQHDEIAYAPGSIAAGFADGFLEDFRSLIGNPVPRRGHTA